MHTPIPTIRTLARELGLSRGTVSNALRGTGRVAPETKERVMTAAREKGYRYNPLAGHVMSELRRSRGAMLRGVIGVLETQEDKGRCHDAFIHATLDGARRRAESLDFGIDVFQVGVAALSIHRLGSILRSRGIEGLLVLPSWEGPRLQELDWRNLCGMYTDRNSCEPVLDRVCSDHYSAMTMLLDLLFERGYRRPGLVVAGGREQRLQCRRRAALFAFQQTHPDLVPVQTLTMQDIDRDSFRAWFLRARPDVVIGLFDHYIEWMEALDARVPETHGFVCLNLAYANRECAGLDLQPAEIGSRAIEMVVGQMLRSQRGLPRWPTTTGIPSRWIEGPTVRLRASLASGVLTPSSAIPG